MDSLLGVLKTVLLVGAAQGILLAVMLLVRKKRNFRANRVLALILLVFSFSIGYHVLSHTRVIPEFFPHELVISLFLTTLGPFLFFYVKILLNPVMALQKKDILHFIPFIVLVLAALVLFFFFDPTGYFRPFQVTIYFLLLLLTPLYIFLSFLKLLGYKKLIKNSFSSLEKINLNWLIFVISFYIVFWASSIVLWAISGAYNYFDFLWLIVSILIYTTGYLGFMQPALFSGEDGGEIKKETQARGRKYEKSTLTDLMAREYYEKLTALMEEKKLYLESDLTLRKLAAELKISTHHLSQILNDKIGKSFYDYINQQRIEEAKAYLTGEAYVNRNIAGIGYDAGFNSLSAFNSAFKKFTALPPTEYRKRKKK